MYVVAVGMADTGCTWLRIFDRAIVYVGRTDLTRTNLADFYLRSNPSTASVCQSTRVMF